MAEHELCSPRHQVLVLCLCCLSYCCLFVSSASSLCITLECKHEDLKLSDQYESSKDPVPEKRKQIFIMTYFNIFLYSQPQNLHRWIVQGCTTQKWIMISIESKTKKRVKNPKQNPPQIFLQVSIKIKQRIEKKVS